MIIIPLFSENTCNTTIMWHNFNMSSPGRPYLRMSDFDTVFRQITAVGEPHRNALGWEGHLVEADEAVFDDKARELLAHRIKNEISDIWGVYAAYPPDQPPGTSERIVELIEFRVQNWRGRLLTVIGVEPGSGISRLIDTGERGLRVPPMQRERILRLAQAAAAKREAETQKQSDRSNQPSRSRGANAMLSFLTPFPLK